MTNQPSKQLGLTVRPGQCPTSDLSDETGQVGRTTHSAINSRGVTSDLPPAVSGATSDLETDLTSLCELKKRINTGVAYCHKRVGSPNAAKGRTRLLRILSREYLPTLNALQDAYPREALEAERDALLVRLERGWQMEDSVKVARTFSKLLVRYEVLTDALDGNVINRTLGRVERAAA